MTFPSEMALFKGPSWIFRGCRCWFCLLNSGSTSYFGLTPTYGWSEPYSLSGGVIGREKRCLSGNPQAADLTRKEWENQIGKLNKMDYSDQKVAFWKGNPFISGKSRLVKYYKLPRLLIDVSLKKASDIEWLFIKYLAANFRGLVRKKKRRIKHWFSVDGFSGGCLISSWAETVVRLDVILWVVRWS